MRFSFAGLSISNLQAACIIGFLDPLLARHRVVEQGGSVLCDLYEMLFRYRMILQTAIG